MAINADHLRAKLSHKREYFGLFLLCLLPVNLWELLVFFYRLSSMRLIMNAWEIAGVIAYLFAFALFEALFVFGLLFIVSLLLPERMIATRLIPIGAVLIILASLAVSLIHLHDPWDVKFITLKRWEMLCTGSALILAGGFIFWIQRNERVAGAIRALAERLEVLSGFYLGLDLLGLGVVLVRNLL